MAACGQAGSKSLNIFWINSINYKLNNPFSNTIRPGNV